MSEAINPYIVLGVPVAATLDEITAAYRSLAQENHPDRGGDTERMTAINLAFEMLSDPEIRKRCDTSLPVLGNDPLLEPIKRLIAKKSRQEIIHVRDDTATHIRSLSAGWGPEWSKQPYHMNAEAARLARHRKELAYLNGLLALDIDQLDAQLTTLRSAA